MPTGKVMVEISPGPAMRASLDVIEVAEEMLGVIPEWHHAERDELAARIETLWLTCERLLWPDPTKMPR